MTDDNRTPIALLVVAMIVWGSTYAVTRANVDDVPPMLFALLRYGVASVALVTIALARGGLDRLPRPIPLRLLVLMGLSGVTVYYAGFNLALTFTTASQGALVQSSTPAVTALMAVIWLRERLSVQRTVGIALAVLGVLLVVARNAPDRSATAPVLGNALMFGTVVAWGSYTMLAKRMARIDPIVVTAIITVVGTVFLLGAALVEGAVETTVTLSRAAWLSIIYLGVFPSALSYVLYTRALRDLEASQVGAFTNVAPLVGVIGGVLFLGESIAPLAIVGGIVVLVGVWLCR